MLTVLLESRAPRRRHVGSTILSMLAHGAVAAVAVALTVRTSSIVRPPKIHTTSVVYVRPTPTPTQANPATPQASRPEASPRGPALPRIDAPLITSTTIPPIDLTQPSVTRVQVLPDGQSHLSVSGIGEPGTPLSGAGGVSDASAVDRAPRILGRAPEPRYPAALRSAGVQGRVLAEFVVDTLGRAELGTLRFTELANPLFGDAVREALARYRFLPGEIAGRRVRTRVALPFDFRLER